MKFGTVMQLSKMVIQDGGSHVAILFFAVLLGKIVNVVHGLHSKVQRGNMPHHA